MEILIFCKQTSFHTDKLRIIHVEIQFVYGYRPSENLENISDYLLSHWLHRTIVQNVF